MPTRRSYSLTQKTLSARVRTELPENLTEFIWQLAEAARERSRLQREEIQVFELSPINHSAIVENQMVVHIVGEGYQRSYSLCLEDSFAGKIVVKDLGDELIMMFSDEYDQEQERGED